MKIVDWKSLSEAERTRALNRPAIAKAAELEAQVSAIMAAVRERGDAAILELTERFDGVRLSSLAVEPVEIRRAYQRLEESSLDAFREAARRIESFHELQAPKSLRKEISDGVLCERRFVPIQKVGLYVPGGSASLPSTVLMLGVPAAIAGCPLRALATPPRKDGSVDPAVLVAADIVGIERVYKMGGAQAVAALAFGSESVPKTDKIFGPGNAWVTEAKLQASRDPRGAACDMPAGPTEVLVIADERADVEFAAADLLAQAEHGPDSQVVLVTPALSVAEDVLAELERQMEDLPRKSIAAKALERSLAIVVGSLDEAIDVSNRYAPEHLILNVERPREWLGRVVNAGSVFVGAWSPEAAGDYASGTNHVLPTYGYARAFGGLTVESFMKSMTIQELNPVGLLEIGPIVETLAQIESLDGHKRSVSRRLKRLRRRASDAAPAKAGGSDREPKP